MKRLVKFIKYTCSVALFCFMLIIACSYIPINGTHTSCNKTDAIYLTSNGIHLDIILEAEDIPQLFQEKLAITGQSNYLAVGWGEKAFYLNVREWKDLTLEAACTASLGLNESLLHLVSYRSVQNDWVKVALCEHQLEGLKAYIGKSLYLNEKANVASYTGYGKNDVFYKAYGNYSCINTCNTWANTAFKEVGMKASLWTPFDFGLLHHYE